MSTVVEESRAHGAPADPTREPLAPLRAALLAISLAAQSQTGQSLSRR